MPWFLRKIWDSLVVVISVLLLMFGLSNVVPGDSARLTIGQHMSPETYTAVKNAVDLDKPVQVRINQYVSNIIRGDWGRSLISHREVKSILKNAIPVTLKLCVFSLSFALILGLSFGGWAAYRENAMIDRFISFLSATGFSLPHFWLALFLQVVFGLWLNMFPISGTGQGQYNFYILPGLSIGIPLGMTYARLIRYFLLDVIKKPYINAVKGWGLPNYLVFFYHVIPNFVYLLIIQLVTDIAYLLGGAVISETIFNLQGIGTTLVQAVTLRDWPVVNGTVLVIAILVTGLNLFVKLTGPLVDPRIKFE